MPSFMEDCRDHIKAGFPGIVVKTTEWTRVEADVMDIADKYIKTPKTGEKYNYRRWTITTGWKAIPDDKDIAGRSVKPLQPPSGSVTKDLAFITSEGETKPAIYLMHVFPEMFRDPQTRQSFRETLVKAKAEAKTLILVGSFDLPDDLEKDFSFLDFSYLSKNELMELAEHLCKSTKGVTLPDNKVIEQVADAALGLTAPEAENAISLSIATKKTLDVDIVLAEKKAIVRKSGLLECYDTPEGLDGVGGLEGIKLFMRERKLAFTQEARDFGLPLPKGILVVGVSGCGKSLIAKAIAGELKLPLVRIDMGRLFGGVVGKSEENLRSALKTLEAISPCVAFLDEIEKALAGASGNGNGDSGTTRRVIATLLTWMQERKSPVFIVATANDTSTLPPEFLRKGRWDEIFGVNLPFDEERMEIAKVHLTKLGRSKLATPANLKTIAEATDHFTGAEIEEAIKSGLWKAFSRGKNSELRVEDIVASAKETKSLHATRPEEIEAMMDWLSKHSRPASIEPIKVNIRRSNERQINTS